MVPEMLNDGDWPVPDAFCPLDASLQTHALPERFTFPFMYTPHPLCVHAAQLVQQSLVENPDLQSHNFGFDPEATDTAYGKMFGVLVVRHPRAGLGYLAAFSGKLGGKNHYPGFVPPVFDLLDEQGFYRREEEKLNQLNRQIEQTEQNPQYLDLLQRYHADTEQAQAALQAARQLAKMNKKRRQEIRQRQSALLSPPEFQTLEAELAQESLREHYHEKDLKRYWQTRLTDLENALQPWRTSLQAWKETRKKQSAQVQQHIFDHYAFLNIRGERKSLADIFQANAAAPPPAGAGECAAPKLLQYAFLHQLQPVAMAEFWWGQSPTGEIRKHGHFYPACRGKCEPILAHMLEGMPVEANPLWQKDQEELTVEILFEDAHLAVVHKPADLLSVPGKNERDSVWLRMKKRFPEAEGPLMVHRLDMGTSGLMLIAKTESAYKILQRQFLDRSVKKRYVALLDGLVPAEEGVIDLPLRVDLDDRPRQMVCYEHGKAARTFWKRISVEGGQTRVHFFPVTGRTHQLRVHAAHPMGLNTPIAGDELYGTRGQRLCLHADQIEFAHPVTGAALRFQLDPDF